MNLPYANKDKNKDNCGWILDFRYLCSIQDTVNKTQGYTSLEDIETILLVANGDEVKS